MPSHRAWGAEGERGTGKKGESLWATLKGFVLYLKDVWGKKKEAEAKNSWIYTNSWNHINNSTSKKTLPLNLVQTTALIQKWGKWEEWNEAKLMTGLVKAALLLQSAPSAGTCAGDCSVPQLEPQTLYHPNKESWPWRISQIVGSGMKMPFPFQITEITYFIVFTRVETSWLSLFTVPRYRALCTCVCVLLVLLSFV